MKVACDRCLKIVSEDSIEVARNWLNISTGSGLKYLFCAKCADVFWKTMFNCDEKDGDSDKVSRKTPNVTTVLYGTWVQTDEDTWECCRMDGDHDVRLDQT